MAKARPQLNKMGGNGPARKAPMSRTSGTAKRLLGSSEAIGFKKKYGMPLTGSASGVKSITAKQAGETLTQGIVTLNKKNKLQVDPVGLAMALPVGKLGKVARALTPKNVRIAGAAKNIVRGARSRVRQAEGAIEQGKWLQEQGTAHINTAKAYGGQSVRFQGQQYVSRGRDIFDRPLGEDLIGTGTHGVSASEAERMVREGTARKVYTKSGINYVTESLHGLSGLGEGQVRTGKTMAYEAAKVATRSGRRVEGGTREASAEIKRRLAALKAAKRNR